jgi:hypothetical protein
VHFFPITAVLLSQYKSEQHHVIAEHVYLLFGQKSINLTIFNFHLFTVCVAQCVVLCRSLFVFSGMCVTQCLVFCVVFCRSLFVFSVVCVAQCLVY